MTTETLTRTNLRETEVLKSTYDEALAIKEAWDHRITRARTQLQTAVRSGEGVDHARRNLNASEIQHAEAVAQMGAALDAWLDAVDTARHRAAVLAISAGKALGRPHAHRTH